MIRACMIDDKDNKLSTLNGPITLNIVRRISKILTEKYFVIKLRQIHTHIHI